jgi:hypothetical protein
MLVPGGLTRGAGRTLSIWGSKLTFDKHDVQHLHVTCKVTFLSHILHMPNIYKLTEKQVT